MNATIVAPETDRNFGAENARDTMHAMCEESRRPEFVTLPTKPKSARYRLLLSILLAALFAAACNPSVAQPSAANEPVVMTVAPATMTPTATPTATDTPTPTATPTATTTPIPTATDTASNLVSPLNPAVGAAVTDTLTTTAPLSTTLGLSVTQPISPTVPVTPSLTLSSTAALTSSVAASSVLTATRPLTQTGPVSPSNVLSDAAQINALLQQPISATLAISGSSRLTESAVVGNLPILVPTPRPAAPATPVRATPVPQPTPDGVARTASVPILMYHYLSVPPADADIYRRDLSVAPELFAQHLDRMQAEGFTTISLYTFLDHLTLGTPLPPKPVILTFDDGYRDNFEHAFPLLAERGMTATFFVVTDFIDEQRPEYMTWDMVREMRDGGMFIESHGRNHVSLAGKDDDYLVWQALGSLETIEFELGARPRFVSYPAGEYDQRTIDIFTSADYWAGFTTRQGATHSNDDMFRLPRVRVRNTTTPDELIRLLELDW